MIIDAFGGPGGWAEGLRLLGLDEIGIEWDPWACATRRAAGHRVVRADVCSFPVGHLARKVDGLILSPPCQAYSTAGNGEARALIDRYVSSIDRGHWAGADPGHEVLEVGRWAEAIRPRWVACEQVPSVLPIWRAYAARWRVLFGWSAWAGTLNSADFGVAQTRVRAFLVARTDGRPALPPEPTHAKHPQGSLFGDLRPWVSMAQALSWDNRDTRWELNRRQQHDGVPVRNVPVDEPAPTLTASAGAKSQWIWEHPATIVAGDPRLSGPGRYDPDTARWCWHRPATTIAGDPRVFPPGGHIAHDGRDNARMVGRSDTDIRLSLAEALTLQSFPPGYPVKGTKGQRFQQVGNAVPPRLAAHVLAAVTGRPIGDLP